MLRGVMTGAADEMEGRLLLLDTCAERATVALVAEDGGLREEELPPRGASARVLGVIRSMLGDAGLQPGQLRAIGVVSGPGSFTGVRVGMAVAKGLSVATGVPLAAVSRLAVLADVGALWDGFAVLGAGREEVYVGEQPFPGGGAERMMRAADLIAMVAGRDLVCARGEMLPAGLLCREVAVSAGGARGLVEAKLRMQASSTEAGSEGAIDANYVRNEEGIYRSRVNVVPG